MYVTRCFIMENSKLTLSMNQETIKKAKRLAKFKKTSVSKLVANFIESLDAENSGFNIDELGPLTREALGILNLNDNRPYKELLKEAIQEKHGRKK